MTTQLTEGRTPVALSGPGATVWLTGLPSSGKSTIATELSARLRQINRRVEILDGDELRTNLSTGLGFSRQDRGIHVLRIGFVAELLASHGVIVIVPVIAPYADVRDEVSAHHRTQGTELIQVHLSTSVDVCRDRDVKGLYARAARGEITNMTGVSDPYEIPDRPDLRIDTAAVDVNASLELILAVLSERNLI